MTRPKRLSRVALSLPFVALLASPKTASALDIGGRIETGVALPLTAPQTERFTIGSDTSIKGYLGLGHFVDLQLGLSMLALAPTSGVRPSTFGTAWSESIGLRLKRPHNANLGGSAWSAVSPWISADALYVRTGSLDRFGVVVGAGVSFPLVSSRSLWLGPFVRYTQIVQPSREGFADRDGRVLSFGINFEFGSGPLPRRHIDLERSPCPDPLPCAPSSAPAAVVAPDLPDRDRDGVSDAMDNCPDVAGPATNGGCPQYKSVIVKPDKLELREKIFFAYDSAEIATESHPLLDEVVQALKDNRGFRVQIEGHTDSTGGAEYNQALSERRAQSVLNYLRDHGIASERLSYKGFGAKDPTNSNTTADGRANNRRVDFVVHFRIVDRSVK